MLRWVATTLVLTALAGCGGQNGTRPDPQRPSSGAARTTGNRAVEAANSRLAPVPPRAVRRCAERGPRRSIAVLCPTQLPEARRLVRHQDLATGRDAYLTNLETRPSGSGEAFHVLAGGRRGRWPLSTARGKWPADKEIERDLRLMPHGALEPGEGAEDLKRTRVSVVRPATVEQRPALLLEPAGYPTGGIHGGHLAVIWNQEGNGYALSLHFAEDNGWSTSEREAILLEAASAMSRFDAVPSG